jgi:hypothetical protein
VEEGNKTVPKVINSSNASQCSPYELR